MPELRPDEIERIRQMAPTHTQAHIAAELGRGLATINSYIGKLGLRGVHKAVWNGAGARRYTADEVAYMRANYRTMSKQAMALHLKTCATKMGRFIAAEIDADWKWPSRNQWLAVDAAKNDEYIKAHWREHTDAQMGEALGLAVGTVMQRRQRLGLKRQASLPPMRQAGQSAYGGHRDLRGDSVMTRAADHVACFDRVPVYRCNDDGTANPKGHKWRYGTVILSSDDLLAKAYRKGFDPDAWRRLAA
jgi:hypothetical protein